MAEFDRNLAVIIGINKYQKQFGISELTTACPDAKKLDKILHKQGYEVDLLVDRQATFDGITNFLTTILPEKIKTDRRVRLLFYFAGHGTTPQDEEGEAGYLIPQDAEPNNRSKFLSMRWVHDALTKLSCHHLLIILDCCFAGAFRFTTRHFGIIPEEISKQRYDRYINHRAWQVITSAAHDQKAVDIVWDNRAKEGVEHSPFADALFQALEKQAADYTKDGITTATELYLYLNDVLLKQNPTKPQVPRFWPLKEHDKGEFIFLTGEFDQTKLPEAPALNVNNNPYQGLESFDEAHRKFFFGREELVTELKQCLYLSEHSFTVVLGVSGSGKSSLVKAGLIPKLREDKETKWRILEPIRPTADPFNALSRTMLSLVRDSEDSEWQLLEELDELLKQARKRLPQDRDLAELQSIWRRSSPIDKLWLIIQHFEELNQWFDREADRRSLQILRQIGLNRSQLVLEHFETLKKPLLSEAERQQVETFHQSCVDLLHSWSQNWKSDRQQFSRFVQDWCQTNSSWRLLLVVDQFEELITQCNKDIREAFLDLLGDVLKACPEQLRVVSTLRADFEPRFTDSEQLKPFWDKARFLMRAMRADELRRAIEGPALEHVLYFETERDRNLVDQLIDEVGQMPGALPLLSFALSEIYREYVQQDDVQDRTLKWKHYRKVGGVARSLTRRANEEYQHVGDDPNLGEAGQLTMRRVMLRMLTLEGGETARRRVPDSELIYPTQQESDRVKAVVDRLVEARLLVKGQETGDAYVEPAHDFLVRGWDKLQDWIKKEQGNLTLQQRLTPAASDWHKNKRDTEYLWIRDPRLSILEDISLNLDSWLNYLEMEFVQHSIEQKQDEVKELEERLIDAEERRVNAELREKAIKIEKLLATNPQESLELAIQLVGNNLEKLSGKLIDEAQTTLRTVMETFLVPNVLCEHKTPIKAVAISADGETIVSTSGDTISFLNRQGNQLGKPINSSLHHIDTVAISSDAQKIITVGENDCVRFWNRQGKQLAKLEHLGFHKHAAISTDGQTLLTGSKNKILRLWNLNGEPVEAFQTATYTTDTIAMSANNQMIVTGGENDKIRLWNPQGRPLGDPLRLGYVNRIDAVAVSADGQTIAGVGTGGGVHLWDSQGGLLAKLQPSNQHNVIAITANGQTIVTGGRSETLRLWNRKGELLRELKHKVAVTSVAISADGQTIVTGSQDGTVWMWNQQRHQITEFSHHSFSNVAISANGQIIVSSYKEGTLYQGDGTIRVPGGMIYVSIPLK